MEYKNSWEFESAEECAKEAIATSIHRDCVVRIVTDSEDAYMDACTYLQASEDCEGYVENGGEYEHWGVQHMSCGNAEWRVHVLRED